MSEKSMERRLEELDNIVKVQSSKGNYDSNEYMRGMANGLILAQACMQDKEPIYFEVPNGNKES